MGAYDCDCINNLEYEWRERKAQLSKKDTTKGATSDLISRMETVEHLRRVIDVTVPITDYDGGYVDGVEVGISMVSTMPTIQPVATDTNVGGTISRQAALEKVRAMQTYKLFKNDDMLLVDKAEVQTELMMLPSVQPEVPACGNGELVAKPEPTDIDAKEAVYNLAEKIGIHQLFALTVELRGEPIQPEPHEGHWIGSDGSYICSECNGSPIDFIETMGDSFDAYMETPMPYCPNCGAKMTISK